MVIRTYLGLAAALAVLAALVWSRRKRLAETISQHANMGKAFNLLKRARFAFGAACIFLYVGAEVSIGSIIVNYLMQTQRAGTLPAQAAGKHVPFYWGGALVGRFIGAYVLRLVSPGKVLAFNAGMVMVLLLISANTVGAVSGWSLAGDRTLQLHHVSHHLRAWPPKAWDRAPPTDPASSAWRSSAARSCPSITGAAADAMGLKGALVVPAICYLGILLFGLYARHRASRTVLSPVMP